jgi:hypothetical protein
LFAFFSKEKATKKPIVSFDMVYQRTSKALGVSYTAVHRIDLVQAFLKKWWVESDFKAPNLPLSLRLKGSGCHYHSIYDNTGTK